MLFRQIFDERLAQYAYLIGCQRTKEAIVVDPERDVDRYLEAAARENLRLVAVTETHIHADFLSGARELATREPGIRLYLPAEGGEAWSYRWPDADRRAWTPLRDGDVIRVGHVELHARHTPGHTPEHLVFLVVDRGGLPPGESREPMAMISGDFVFVGDLGRPDLLETAAGEIGAREPSARRLYASARDLLRLPEWLQIWPGHGAGSSCGKALGAVPSSTLGYERRTSPALAAAAGEEAAFVDFILDGQPEPPVYFARMKRLNRDGPPLLDGLPRPARLASGELAARLERGGTAVLDTRRDRAAFFARHARGSLFVPLNRTFSTVAGTYVAPEEEIVLLVAEEDLEAAVRGLVRVGLDRITGWCPPATLDELPASALASRPRLASAAEFEAARRLPGALVVDVRGENELEQGAIEGALHLAAPRLPAEVAELDRVPPGAPLLVHCEAGARAAPATAFLARRGLDARLVDVHWTEIVPRTTAR